MTDILLAGWHEGESFQIRYKIIKWLRCYCYTTLHSTFIVFNRLGLTSCINLVDFITSQSRTYKDISENKSYLLSLRSKFYLRSVLYAVIWCEDNHYDNIWSPTNIPEDTSVCPGKYYLISISLQFTAISRHIIRLLVFYTGTDFDLFLSIWDDIFIPEIVNELNIDLIII